MRKSYVFVAGLMLLLAMMACSPGSPSVADILVDAGDALEEVETVKFYFDFQDAPIVLDESGEATVQTLDGQYRAPNDVFVQAKVDIQGVIVQADILWIPDGIFLRSPPFQPDFEQMEGEASFNPSDVFAPDGLPSILHDSVEDPTLEGEEDVDGVATYHIVGRVYESAVVDVFGPEFDDGNGKDNFIDIELWIDKDTNLIVKFSMVGADGTWEGEFYDYGEEVEIPEL